VATDYNQIADLYAATEALPSRSSLEVPLLFRALGDITGKTVLDLACGDGFHTRLLKRGGALKVVGVDISKKMVEIAAAIEEQDPLGIDYLLHDVGELPILGAFDIATAIFLVPYAQSREQLLRMFRSIRANLRPGGRFAALVTNPDFKITSSNYTKYGLTVHFEGPRGDGCELAIDFHTSPPFSIRNYFWTQLTLEQTLSEAGFQDITWMRPEMPAGDGASFDGEFWREYIDNPHVAIVRGEAAGAAVA
jgi:SAM-dependent methyltransferase